MRRVTGLPDDQVTAWEAKLEQQVVDSLQSVMDRIAARIERIQVASVLVAVATTGPTGDDDPPPMTGELAIPEPVPLPEVLPPDAGLSPGQPYISPDDLASIAPMWQQAVAEQVLPLAAQVFIDSMGHVRSQFLDAVGPGVTLGLPGLGSVAAEEYLARSRNTFDEIGDHLWATARAQLSEGFDAGESIPQLGARLRQSAGLSARTAVMVARTQVIEASNAGSIAMARASRLEMEKEFIATPDLRTRPTHLRADGQRVALSAKFLVGGYLADFPGDPSLPPSERYSCRCTIGYVMPERQPALPGQDLAQLPGATAPAAAELEAPPEPALGEVLAKEPGEAGFDLDDFPEPPPIKVRSSLLRARTDRELIAAWQGEMRAITGRDIIVQLPPDSSVLTMREHAEGVLQMLERFPEARLRKISWYDTASTEYAHVRAGSGTLEFNAKWASTAQRREYLASLRHDVSGWDDSAGPGYGWSVRGAKNPQATSWHEMAHILSIETLGGKLKAEAMRITLRRMADAGTLDMGDFVSRQISAYAASKKGNLEEMIAEAMTDVMANGPRASLLSRELYDMVAREYRAKGFAVRTAGLPDLGDEFEDFTRIPDGEVFPKAPAPKQPRVTVAIGRDLTDDHELAVRAEREAERERALPTDAMGRAQLPEGYQGDYAFQELAKAQGFSGLPRIVADDGQWQTLLDADYVPLYRGHGWAGGDGVGQVDAFNYGERYVGGGFAPGNNMSTRYETALYYADGHSAAVGHYALPTNARVISYPDLVAERDAYIARLPAGEAGDVERSLYLTADENLGLGRFGVARGYDAMVVPRGEQLLTDRVEEWVIFNRSKLVAYDDSAKGVASASGKVTPTKMSAQERVRRERDAAIVSARQVGHLTRELDQMISEGGEEAFRSGALFRRIKAKGSELDTPPAVMREFIAASRPSEKGSSLAALRAAMERANAEVGVTRIGTPGEVWRFSGRRDDPTGAVRDIAEGTPVVVVRPGSLIEYKGKPLQIAPPRVRPATPGEIAAAGRATPSAPPAPTPSAPRLATMKIGDLRALAKERGVTVPAGTRKADLVRMLDEGPPALPVSVVPSAALPARVVAARADLERVASSPVVREDRLGGTSSYTFRQTTEAGDEYITKDYSRLGPGPTARRDADAEELGSLVMDALDVPTQTVVRLGPERVAVSVLRGDEPGFIGPLSTEAKRQVVADTDAGHLLGLGDMLIGNNDRSFNWVRLADGRPASYDLGSAFRTPKLAGAGNGDSAFSDFLLTPTRKAWAPNDMAPADLALIRQRLEALRPEFERLKRGTWFNQMMARLAEVEKRATGTRTRLAEAVGDVASPEVRAVARQATIDERRAVADSLGEVRELLANGASERALASRARLIAGRTTGQAKADLDALVKAMESGDADRIRVALGDVAQRRGLTEVGGGSDVVAFDPKIHEVVGGARRPPVGTFVQVQRPGYSVRLDDGEIVQLSKAKVDTLTVEEIAERTAAQERKALREAARERNRVIEAQRATAKLLAEVDELAAKGATKTAIRERLDPALREAGQAYAGADAAVVDTISAALDSGDMAKIRAAVTRASTKAKIKPIGRAGAKTTFDPDTMEGVGGIDIAPGAKVTVVRRGSTLPGVETPEKAQVTPVVAPVKAAAPKSRAPRKAKSSNADIERRARTGVVEGSEVDPGQGVSAVTRRVQFEDGTFGYRKTVHESEFVTTLDDEYLDTLVMQAVGAPVPGVYRASSTTLYLQEVKGKIGRDLTEVEGEAALASPEGRLIGLGDALMGNADRHIFSANVVGTPEGRIVAIDNAPNLVIREGGERWEFQEPRDSRGVPLPQQDVEGNDFIERWVDRGPEGSGVRSQTGAERLDEDLRSYDEALVDVWRENDLTRAEYLAIRAHLEALRSEFEALNRADQLSYIIGRLDAIAEASSVAATRRAAIVNLGAGPITRRATTASARPERIAFDGCWRCGADQVTYHQVHECP